MKSYQVTASIVVYKNNPAELTCAVRSVLSTPMRVKCTVIDNSPTRSLEQCAIESGATYLHTGKNIGFGSGHNLALKSDCASSDYHLVLNPDVHFASDILVSLYQFMNGNVDIGLVMPRVVYPDGRNQQLCKQIPSPLDLISRRFLGRFKKILFSKRLNRYELHHIDLSKTCEVPCLSGCFMFIRSDALRKIGYFDERYFMYMEDVDLCRRIGSKYKTAFFPKVTVTHGYTKGSYRNIRLLRYHLQSAFKYFSKWGWFFDADRNQLNKRACGLITDESLSD